MLVLLLVGAVAIAENEVEYETGEKIHPGLPELSFKIFGKELEDNTISANNIEIYKINENKQKVQEIELDAGHAHDAEQIVIIEDMNFNEYKDFRVQIGIPPGPNIPYHFWLWDKEAGIYVRASELDKLTSPTFNHANETITTFNRASAGSSKERVYKYLDNELTLIEEVKREVIFDNDKKLWRITIKELINGELEITEIKEEPLN